MRPRYIILLVGIFVVLSVLTLVIANMIAPSDPPTEQLPPPAPSSEQAVTLAPPTAQVPVTVLPADPEPTTARPSPRAPRSLPTTRLPSPAATGTPTATIAGNYPNCSILRIDYPEGVASNHPAYETRLDPDGDGWACEL